MNTNTNSTEARERTPDSTGQTALVIGGTGPTGPHIVNGLIDRGYAVTILHSGLHEVEFKKEIEHIHADVHFRETFVAALGDRRWDLVVASYGRLQLAVEVLKGRTGRVVAIGGGPVASRDDPRWGPLGPAANLDEVRGLREENPERNKLYYQMAQAEQALFCAHQEGHFNATQICYPILYGPRQPAANDWCIVRRALDKRRPFIIADGGIKLEARAFTENAAHAVLLAIDQPAKAAGQKYLVADDLLFTMRQRIETIARIMGHEFELVDMPWDLAVPCHVLWRRDRNSRFRDASKIRRELGYTDIVDSYSALRQSVAWLLANREDASSELEKQLGDPFDYAREDVLIKQWQTARAQIAKVDYPLPQDAHMYRHPTKVNEEWKRPT
jgi:nucleoside-diphosphate-sugar epimerase